VVNMSDHSRYGVWYNLSTSPYTAETDNFIFSFSTIGHKERFEQEFKKREEWLSDSLSRRFKVIFDANVLSHFQLYEQLEKRGCYVVSRATGRAITDLSSLNFTAIPKLRV